MGGWKISWIDGEAKRLRDQMKKAVTKLTKKVRAADEMKSLKGRERVTEEYERKSE
jgi:hypothetical protein